jgi:hypothetical protein
MQEGQVPAWAQVMSAERYGRMRSLIEAGLWRHQCTFVWFETEGRIDVRHPKVGRRVLTLVDLAQVLAKTSESEWRSQVGHFLRVMLAKSDDDDALDPDDFASVQPRLRLRLWPREGDAFPAGMVGMPVMPGVDVLLMIDLPDASTSATRDNLAAWGIEEREVLALALHNTLGDPASFEQFTTEDGLELRAIEGEGMYIASFALALERFCDEKAGALVVVPNRHLVLYHPIRDERAFEAMYRLWGIAQTAHAEGPGAISRDLYWWTPGKFTRVEVREEVPGHGQDGEPGVAVVPPAELLATMRALFGGAEA